MVADPARRTILITGIGSGFGKTLAAAALDAGHRVIGTARDRSTLRAFEAGRSESACGILLDMNDHAAFPSAVARAEARSGPIDVLVNNAGFGLEGVVEETPLEAFRRQFDTNLFGPIALIQAVLPGMRARRSGHIVNITSVAGFRGVAALGAYSASKCALEGLTESLALEVARFGIAVTAVAPGSFRTDFGGRSLHRSERRIGDYDAFVEPLTAARREKSGRQLGDPARAALAMLALIETADPPRHLVLGTDGLALIREKLAFLKDQMTQWESVSRSTDCAS